MFVSILASIALVFFVWLKMKKSDAPNPTQTTKKIPAVILEYEENKRKREEYRKAKIEELLSRPLTFDPKNNASLKHLLPVQQQSQCLFAKNAKAWGNEWDPSLTLEENIERMLPALMKFFLVGEELRLDAFSIEVQGHEYSSTVAQLGETVRRVLTVISDHDPGGDHVMNDPRIHLRGWRYKFNSEEIFVTVLAPCYSSTHARYTFNAGGDLHCAFILIQPEWSFGHHNIGPDHVWDDQATTVRQKIRHNFVKHGRKYFVPPGRFYAMAPQVIPSLQFDGCTPAGLCNNETLACDCRENWIGKDCSLFFYSYDYGLWAYFIVHLIFFCLCFIGVMIWAIILIVKLFKAKKFNRKEINKPTLTLFILVLFFGFERAFYIALYQYGRVLEVPEVVGSILFGFAISTLIAMQLYVCNLWISAYLKTKPRMANVLKKLQKTLQWIAIGFAIWELIVDILTSIPQTSPIQRAGIQIAYLITVLLLLFSTTISLLVFGAKLRRQLKVFKDIDNKRKKVVKKINSFGITVSVIMLIVFIIIIGLIIISSNASADVAASLAYVVIQQVLMRAAELAYCITVLVTYQKSVKETISSSSGQTGKNLSRAASTTVIIDTDSKRHDEDHTITSPVSQSDAEIATPTTTN